MERVMRLAELLCGTSRQEQSVVGLKEVLASRLTQYYSAAGLPDADSKDMNLEDVQRDTALAALQVVEDAQDIYLGRSEPTMKAVLDRVGARDLKQIRTLLSIVFKWGITPPLVTVEHSFPHRSGARTKVSSAMIDITSAPKDYTFVSSFTSRLLRLIYPDGVHGALSPTIITVALLERHVSDLLRPCLSFGWLPKSLETPDTPVKHEFRQPIMRLLSNLPTVESIASLGAVLQSPSIPDYVRKTCNTLLNRQLLRPDGVQGLFIAVYGDKDQSALDTPMEKYEHVCRVFQTVPAGVTEEEYYSATIPRIMAILQPKDAPQPDHHFKAAAYSLSYMLTDIQFRHRERVSSIVATLIQAPFLVPSSYAQPPRQESSSTSTTLLPEQALATLIKIITNTDPSPYLISQLLSPILPALYMLKDHISRKKAVDPALHESLEGVLSTWGRIVDNGDGSDVLWRIIEGEGGFWEVDIAGSIKRTKDAPEEPPELSMFTPESLHQAESAGEFNIDANVMNLRPDPVRLVHYLKAIDRPDIVSNVFVRCLEEYRELKTAPSSDPLRALLFLQIIIQMQTQISGDSSKSDLLSRPDHILSFIKHALGPEQSARKAEPTQLLYNLNIANLRIVSDDPENQPDVADSDDESEESDDELTSTAVNLLLAVLERNPKLSSQSTPILNDIFELLEPLTTGQSESLRGIAREARMVITARMASLSGLPPHAGSDRESEEDDSQEVYQKALKLLQDPILPVRAHGLLLLRQLVSAKSQGAGTSSVKSRVANKALIPAILPIFMQSLQDEDSYIYLNSVQGLSAMVDTHGKEVLKSLINAYCGDLDGLPGAQLNVAQLDVHLRVGEALSQIIKRCGTTLGIHANILVPALFRVVRISYIPATLRSSALSLLAQCASTYSLALLPYADDLVGGVADLLQTEAHTSSSAGTEANLDMEPTTTSAKVAPLRRSAIHLVSLVLRSSIQNLYDAGTEGLSLEGASLRRLGLTLRYVTATDPDGVVKMMAREGAELAEQLERAKLGL